MPANRPITSLLKMAAPMFELVYSVTADGNVPVTKYRSQKTGITVFIAQVEGPLVNGYFCLGETHEIVPWFLLGEADKCVDPLES